MVYTAVTTVSPARQPPSHHQPAALPGNRIYLMNIRTFSWLAVVVGVSATAVGWFGIAGTLAILVVAACVAAHVAGNAIGTSFRDATDRETPQRSVHNVVVPARQSPSLLERGESLGRLVPVSAGIGSIAGGAIGVVCLIVFVGSSVPGAVLGGISSAVIGGIGGFLISSFIEVVRSAFREADEAENPRQSRRPQGG
jgi:hypothetical protein